MIASCANAGTKPKEQDREDGDGHEVDQAHAPDGAEEPGAQREDEEQEAPRSHSVGEAPTERGHPQAGERASVDGEEDPIAPRDRGRDGKLADLV